MDTFFKSVKVPGFLEPMFQKDNWFLIVKDLRDLIKANVEGVQLNSENPTMKVIGDNIYVGKNCNISEYVVIEGPAYIGDNVEIGPHV